MYPHHERAIEAAVTTLRRDPAVRAILLGGSIAHGFARPGSDVDLIIVVDESDYEARMREGRPTFATAEACDWEGGYVEGKYLCRAFLEDVARRGSEPARFAFQDARVLHTDLDGLDALLAEIARYPVEDKAERIARFAAQFEAWHWYGHEALKLGDRYLLGLAVARMTLFGGRMLLAHNQRLYPYHKWLLRVLEGAPDRPADLMERIAALHETPTQESLLRFWATIRNFRTWEGSERPWNVQFLHDSELNWQSGHTPIDDL
jgi:hypothetical protein